MFAYGFPRGTAHPLNEIEQAAQLMYYGGHMAELLLVVAFFAAWFRGGADGRGRAGAVGAFAAR